MTEREKTDLCQIWSGLDHALNTRRIQEAKGYAADLRFFIENGRIPGELEGEKACRPGK